MRERLIRNRYMGSEFFERQRISIISILNYG